MSHPEHVSRSGTHWGRSRWLWVAVAVIVVAVGVTATIWVFRSTHGATDCTVVEQLGPEWKTMQQTVSALQNGAGDIKDLVAVADQESAMSNKIRAAGSSVSTPSLKDALTRWADGTALAAKNQRDAAGQSPASSGDADTARAATMTYDATAALRNACPNLNLS